MTLTQILQKIKSAFYTKSETDTKLNAKANDNAVVHKSGNETVNGTKTFSSQIKGSVSGTSSDVVVGSDTAITRGYLVNGKLPWYKWEEGSQAIGSTPIITDFNNLTKPGVYHVVFCLNDGFVHQENEYKETLNRPSIPGSTTGFMDAILEIKQTTTMHTISSAFRLIQKLTLLSGSSKKIHTDLTYHRVCIMYSPINEWTAWKRVARDDEVVHKSGDETIVGTKTFSDVTCSNKAWFNGDSFLKMTNLESNTTTPTSAQYKHIKVVANDDSQVGSIQFCKREDGSFDTTIYSHGGSSGANNNGTLRITSNNEVFPINNKTKLGNSTAKWSEVWANTFNGNLVAKQINTSNDSSLLRIFGGTSASTGANLDLYGENESTSGGNFTLRARNSSGYKALIGKIDGTLTWDGSVKAHNVTVTNDRDNGLLFGSYRVYVG